MNMYSVIVVFAAATFAGDVMATTTPEQPPEKCCLPEKASMDMYDTSTINSEVITRLFTQIDFTRGLQATVNYTLNPQTKESQEQMRVVVDNNAKMTYAILASEPTKCFKAPFNAELLQCIPDDAVYLGSSYMGLNELQLNEWRFQYDEKMQFTIITLSESCVPVAEGVRFLDSSSPSFAISISNFQEGLTDTSAFDLPESCKH